LGGRDSDLVAGGAGDDTLVWNPGDGSDVLEGNGGADTLMFNGANIAETIDILANGSRVTFQRNIAIIAMDCNGVETIQFNAVGGADIINVGNLTGTDVTAVNLSLQSSGGTTDGAADVINIAGTGGNDTVAITGAGGNVSVTGLSATVNIAGSEPTLDTLVLTLLGGNDTAVATGLANDSVKLVIDGGIGEDSLFGSAGDDTLLGDEGDDLLTGGPGVDILDGGAGNNIVIQD
jgi:Ca2+-binding RTX toxin-like protein